MKKNLLTVILLFVAIIGGVYKVKAQCKVTPNVNLITSNTPCNSNIGTATANVTGGIAPYTFSWSNGATTAADSNLAPGVYQVTVYDSNNCSSTATATISNTNGPSVTPTVTNVKCNNDSNGSISLAVTGTSPFYYAWSQPGNQYFCPGATIQINSSLTNIPAGTYLSTVQDKNGCTTTQKITVSQPAAMYVVPVTANATCTKADGSATVNVVGGTSPYTYSWNHAATTTAASMNNISAGYYNVMVTDAKGCVDSFGVLVNSTKGPVPYITATTNYSCVTGTMGSVTVTDSNGASPYSFLWSDGTTGQTINGVGGIYYVTTTDNNGCVGAAAVAIPQALPLGASVCMVTVDTIRKTTIIWNRTNERQIKTFNLYRKATNDTGYILRASFCSGIGTIYTDSVSNTSVLGYSYEVSEIDSCGNESPMSPAVNSILMTATNSGSNVVLNWAAYQGTFGSYYYIYRDTVKNVFVVYDSVANGVLTYTDTKPLTTTSPVYYTIGIQNGGCTPTQSINEPKGKPPGAYTSAKSNTGKVVHGTLTSVNEISELSNVSVYPNPSTGVFNIAVKGITYQQEAVSIKVTGVTGQVIYTEDCGKITGVLQKQINLSGISKGVYFVKIVSNKGILNKAVVVQ